MHSITNYENLQRARETFNRVNSTVVSQLKSKYQNRNLHSHSRNLLILTEPFTEYSYFNVSTSKATKNITEQPNCRTKYLQNTPMSILDQQKPRDWQIRFAKLFIKYFHIEYQQTEQNNKISSYLQTNQLLRDRPIFSIPLSNDRE